MIDVNKLSHKASFYWCLLVVHKPSINFCGSDVGTGTFRSSHMYSAVLLPALAADHRLVRVKKLEHPDEMTQNDLRMIEMGMGHES